MALTCDDSSWRYYSCSVDSPRRNRDMIKYRPKAGRQTPIWNHPVGSGTASAQDPIQSEQQHFGSSIDSGASSFKSRRTLKLLLVRKKKKSVKTLKGQLICSRKAWTPGATLRHRLSIVVNCSQAESSSFMHAQVVCFRRNKSILRFLRPAMINWPGKLQKLG